MLGETLDDLVRLQPAKSGTCSSQATFSCLLSDTSAASLSSRRPTVAPGLQSPRCAPLRMTNSERSPRAGSWRTSTRLTEAAGRPSRRLRHEPLELDLRVPRPRPRRCHPPRLATQPASPEARGFALHEPAVADTLDDAVDRRPRRGAARRWRRSRRGMSRCSPRAGPRQQKGIQDELRAGIALRPPAPAGRAGRGSPAQRCLVEAVGARLRALGSWSRSRTPPRPSRRGDGQVAAKVAPDIDERRQRASPLQRLQPCTARRPTRRASRRRRRARRR